MLAFAVAIVAPGRARFMAFPAALVLFETVRSRWPLGGLPLSGLALGQVDGPMLPLARFGGSLAVVSTTAALGAAVAAAVFEPAHRRISSASAALW